MDSIGNKKRNTFYINGVICNQSKPRSYNYKLTYNNPSLTSHSLSVACHNPSVASHSFSLVTPSLRLFLSTASNTSIHNSLILSNNRGFLFSENKILVDDTFNRKITDKVCVVFTLIPKYVDLIPKPVMRKPYPETINQQSL